MNRKIVIVILILVTIFSWGQVVYSKITTMSEVSSIKQYIAANEELKLYKNIVAGYQQLIPYEGSYKNYHALTQAYKDWGKSDEYHDALINEINHFPDQIDGYVALFEYYDQGEEAESIINMYNATNDTVRGNDKVKAIYQKYRYNTVKISDGYDEIRPMMFGNYVVKVENKYGYMDAKGELVIPIKYDEANHFSSNFGPVKLNGKWYLIDLAGDEVRASKENITYIGSFGDNGMAPVAVGKEYGYIDSNMNITNLKCEYTGAFMNKIAAVKKDGKWALINEKLEPITEFIYEDIILKEDYCSDGGYVFAKKNGKYQLLGLDGKVIGKGSYDDAKLFIDGSYAAVKSGDKWGFIDHTGKQVIDYVYEDADSFVNGIGLVKLGGYQYIDINKKILISDMYEEATAFNKNGVAIVKDDDCYTLIQLLAAKLKNGN